MIGALLSEEQIERTLERHGIADVELIGISYDPPIVTVRDDEGGVYRLIVPQDVLRPEAFPEPSIPGPEPLFPRDPQEAV